MPPSADNPETSVQPPPGAVIRVEDAEPLTLSTAKELGGRGSKPANAQNTIQEILEIQPERAKTPCRWPWAFRSVMD